MNSMTTRNDLADFLNNPENAQWLNVLVEDTRYALMDYQVWTPKTLPSFLSNAYLRLHYNGRSTKKAVRL